MNVGYLVYATNEIFRILLSSQELTQQDLQRAFTVACNALKQLADDKEFFDDLALLVKRREEHLADVDRALADIDHFTDCLLADEKRLLLEAGIFREAVEALIDQAKELREVIRRSRANSDEVRVSIIKLRNETCNLAEAVQREVVKQEEKQQRKALLKKIGYFLGGVTLVGINATAHAAGLLPGPEAAISEAFGRTLMSAVWSR